MKPGGTFTSVLTTLTVSYPVPFLCALLLAYALAAFATALLAPPLVETLAAITAVLSFLAVVTLIGFSVSRRPELLRSEQHTIEQKLLDLAGDSDVSADVRKMAVTVLQGRQAQTRPKQPADRLSAALTAERKAKDE